MQEREREREREREVRPEKEKGQGKMTEEKKKGSRRILSRLCALLAPNSRYILTRCLCSCLCSFYIPATHKQGPFVEHGPDVTVVSVELFKAQVRA